MGDAVRFLVGLFDLLSVRCWSASSSYGGDVWDPDYFTMFVHIQPLVLQMVANEFRSDRASTLPYDHG